MKANTREAVGRLTEEESRLEEHLARLKDSGLGEEEIKRVTDPFRSFHEQLQEEVTSYERLKRGEFDGIENLHGLGSLLVSLRICPGPLATGVGCPSWAFMNRKSRAMSGNEYHGITLDRASRILEALGARLITRVQPAVK